MRFFSAQAKRKPPAAVRPDARTPAEVVSITRRRIEITVEREWSQAVSPAQDNAPPVQLEQLNSTAMVLPRRQQS